MEFEAFAPPPADADAVVLAGDISLGTRGVRFARRWFDGVPVLFVAGNHEYYRHALPALTAELRAAAAGSAVHVLETNDYKVIAWSVERRKLRPEDTRALHLESRRWLEQRLAQPHDGPTVVITHHAPLLRTRLSDPLERALAGAFASDLRELMTRERVALWIYGHTHRAADFEIDGTRLVSNPRGYPHEPVAEFDAVRVVEVR